MPAVLIRRGRICRPADPVPQPLTNAQGDHIDPFDIIDRLAHQYSKLYLIDLDGIERGEPQLDYVQEFSRDIPLWVDAGVRTADQSIDILVAGAQRAVISSSELSGPEELERAWELSTELAFEIVLTGGNPQVRRGWDAPDPLGLARAARAIGPDHVIVTVRDGIVPWSLVRSIAASGPTWVGGVFAPADRSRLKEAGAAGGVFSPESTFDEFASRSETTDVPNASTPLRDDEN